MGIKAGDPLGPWALSDSRALAGGHFGIGRSSLGEVELSPHAGWRGAPGHQPQLLVVRGPRSEEDL